MFKIDSRENLAIPARGSTRAIWATVIHDYNYCTTSHGGISMLIYEYNIYYSNIIDILVEAGPMPLTHVCEWINNSWVHIDIKDAVSRYRSGTISAHQHLFMCEICRQYVTLTDGTVRDRYFKHSAEEENKDCEDRTFLENTPNFHQHTAEDHSLPIKLNIKSSNRFTLEIGFLPLPLSLLEKCNSHIIKIKPIPTRNSCFFSSTSIERLYPDTLKYFDIGEVPALKYTINIDPNNDEIKLYWPASINGIDESGTLFNGDSRKKLPHLADVQVSKKYWLLTKHVIKKTFSSIQLREICRSTVQSELWYIYEVKATILNEEAAKFFLNLHCKLTEQLFITYPIWPVCVQSPYIIYHNNDIMHLFFQGNTYLETRLTKYKYYINNNIFRYTIYSHIQQDYLAYYISNNYKNALRYTYLRKVPLNDIQPAPTIKITDIHGHILPDGEQHTLPFNETIEIQAQYDGFIVISNKSIITTRCAFRANDIIRLNKRDVRYNQEIKVFQGLDCVWDVCYKHLQPANAENDTELVAKLRSCRGKNIVISHSIGRLSNDLINYPLTKRWLYKVVRDGKAPANAILLLRQKLLLKKGVQSL